jgi:Sulfatase
VIRSDQSNAPDESKMHRCRGRATRSREALHESRHHVLEHFLSPRARRGTEVLGDNIVCEIRECDFAAQDLLPGGLRPAGVSVVSKPCQGIPTAELGVENAGSESIDSVPGPMSADWKFEDLLPKLLERAIDYVETAARNERRPFFLYLPFTSPHEPVVPSQDFVGRSAISRLADFMVQTDAALGTVLERLETIGVADNTLVIYTSDNGHSDYLGFEGFKEVGHRVNGPLRGYKGSIYEGGHRVPLVVRWPDGIRGTNRVADDLVGLVDLSATIAELAKVRGSQRANEDSISFARVLHGRRGPRRSLVNHSASGQFAIRDGRWKLVLPDQPKQLTNDYWKPEALVAELYDLQADLAET